MRRFSDDFPILALPNGDNRLIYLDNGATTQKPRQVLDAVTGYYLTENANPHRGVYDLAMRATDAHENARAAVAKFLNVPVDTIVFTQNASEALNLAAYSYGRAFLKAGDEILVYVAEHHSNLVPWQRVAKETGAALKYLYPDENGRLTEAELKAKITERTKVVAVAHVSNVLGLETPVDTIVRLAHSVGAVVVLGVLQSIAHMPVDLTALDVDFAAFSGHKIYAPMGVGGLYGKAELLDKMPPFLSGGDMIAAVHETRTTYAEAPRKFEAGTRNVGGEVGLAAALDYVSAIGWETIVKQEEALIAQTVEGMKALGWIDIYGEATADGRHGVISFNVKDVHPHDVATILDSQGVCIRAGHHCAQPLMERLGIGSCCRASFAVYNTAEDVEALLQGLKKVREVMGLGS